MHKEFEFIRDICKQNGYFKNFVQRQIGYTWNRYMYIEKQNKLNTVYKESKINKSEHKQDDTNETHTDRITLNVPFVGKATQ